MRTHTLSTSIPPLPLQPIKLVFANGWGLEGVVAAQALDSAHAAFSLTAALFQAVLRPPTVNNAGAAGLVEVGATGAGTAGVWVTGLQDGGGANGGDTSNWKVALVSTANHGAGAGAGAGELAVYETMDASGYRELNVSAHGLEALLLGNVMVTVALVSAGAGGAGAGGGGGGAVVGEGLLRPLPRQLVGLLPDENSRDNKVAGLAVGSLLPSGNVAFTVWATGLEAPALGNSAVAVDGAGGGVQKHLFTFDEIAEYTDGSSGSNAGWYDSRGTVAPSASASSASPGVAVTWSQLAQGSAGNWEVTVRTAAGVVCSGMLALVGLAGEYSESSVKDAVAEEDTVTSSVGMFNVLLTARDGGDVQDNYPAAWMQLHFDANEATLVYTVSVAAAGDLPELITFREASAAGTVLFESSSASGVWTMLAGKSVGEKDRILKLLARGEIYACIRGGGVDAVAVAARINREPLYVSTPSSVVIAETTTPGQVMFSNDADRRYVYYQAPLVYATVADDRFSVRGRSSTVEVRDSGYGFDYNRQSEFTVVVKTEDPGSGRVDQSSVRVSLADVNNLPPRFPQRLYSAEIASDAPVGTIVAELVAVDGDVSFPELTYSLLQGSTADVAALFEVLTIEEEDADGNYQYRAVLRTRSGLAAIADGTAPVSIQVDDGVNEVDVASVVVTVTATNDAAPRFVSNASAVCADGADDTCTVLQGGGIPEDLAVGTAVYWFSASDTDNGINSELRFSTAGRDMDPAAQGCGAGTGMFTAVVTSVAGSGRSRVFRGELVVARALDFESVPEYVVCVAVLDGGTPALRSTIKVALTITDVPFKILLLDSNLASTSEDGAALFLPRVADELKVVFGVNDESKAAATVAAGGGGGSTSLTYKYRLRVDRTSPVDCVLAPWSPQTACIGATGAPMHSVSGVACRRSSAEQLGQMKMQRDVVQLRDLLGLGRDCPRASFDEARFLSDHDAGDVLLTQWASCGAELCADVAQNGGGAGGADNSTADPGGNAGAVGLQLPYNMSFAEARAFMNTASAWNGFSRNHPTYDGWAIDGAWKAKSEWDTRVLQTLTWSSSDYNEQHGIRGQYLDCTTAGEAGASLPTCSSTIDKLTGGPHVIDVEVVRVDAGLGAGAGTDADADWRNPVLNTTVSFFVDRDPPLAFFANTPGICRRQPSVTGAEDGGRGGAFAMAFDSAACAFGAVGPDRDATFTLMSTDTDTSDCKDPLCSSGADLPACSVCDRGTPISYLCRIDLPPGGPFSPCPVVANDDSRISGRASSNLQLLLPASASTAVTIVLAGLSDGPHSLVVKAVDAAGNDAYLGESRVRPLLYEWDVDTRTPVGMIASWPQERRTSSREAAFQFASDEPGSHFRCELDGTAANCGSSDVPGVGAVAYRGLPHGTHTFRVLVTDGAGNQAAADGTPEFEWMVDTAGPALQFVTAPEGAVYPLGDISAAKSWIAHWWSDEVAVGHECRFNDYVPAGTATAVAAAAAQCCDGAFSGVLPDCVASCASGNAFSVAAECLGDTSAAADVARRSYSVCLLAALREAGPAAVPRAAGWAPCTSPFNATELEHGHMYVLEVIGTDDKGNTGSKDAPLLWFWAVNDMHVDRISADVAEVRHAATLATSDCTKVSTVLIAITLVSWFFLLTLCLIVGIRKKFFSSLNNAEANDAVAKAHEKMSYNQALQMMGMDQREDFFRVEIEPGYTDAYGERWDQTVSEYPRCTITFRNAHAHRGGRGG